MTQEIKSARVDVASVPLDPFKVQEAVHVEISNRFEKVRALMDEILDWARSTKHLPDAEMSMLSENRNAIAEIGNSFDDRANAPTAEQPTVRSG